MQRTTVKAQVGANEISIETGLMAKQADGAVLVRAGNNIVMVTVVSSRRPTKMDFFPMTVEFQEKFYATGKIPGGYFKREGRPTELALLTCRLIDRPIRPLFPEGYKFDTQIVATVLSSDGEFPADILAGMGASAALHISDIPFAGPTCSMRIGRVAGEWISNPTPKQLEESDVDMVIAGTRKGLLMVEGEAEFLTEEELLKALKFAHEAMTPIFDIQDQLREKVGRKKREFTPYQVDADLRGKFTEYLKPLILEGLQIREKLDRYAKYDEVKTAALEKFTGDIADKDEAAAVAKDLSIVYDDVKFELAREMILSDKIRIDGRDTTTVRPIACEVGLLPRAHGSGLFTRGETQVLGTVTLGTGDDEQRIDSLQGLVTKNFLLHYNFPPYCVGETGRMGGQSRREIGHGFLAERSIAAILPDLEKFPYTIRIVSEVLESNGSSSMGTVCSGMMALLDAGVPVKGNVAGIAMGLIKEGDRTAVLTDILGDEDHLGDMDFKVAGTKEGITAFQMDIKIDNVTFDIMEQALKQAKDGRVHILNEMEKVISSTREDLSEHAPRIEIIQIKPDKVREVIGPGGKMIKEIIAKTEVKINIQDDGTVSIASNDPEARRKAVQMVHDITAEAEVGKVYKGKVVKIMDFGAFVEVLPNTSGLLHISEIAHERVRQVTDVLNEGDEVEVKVLDVDRTGRIKLSRKVLLEN